MQKVAIIISPNWGDYAKKYLDDCIDSINKQDWHGQSRIFITDNETSEESFAYLKKKLPQVEIIRNKNNDGYAKGCNDSIRAALKYDFDYLVIFNIHTILKSDCLKNMIETANKDDKIGAVQARMMLWSDKEKISSLGNSTHFLGFGYCAGYKKKFDEKNLKVRDIFYPSGSSFLIKKEILDKIGLLDEELWMYNEDQDWGWRIWLAGYRCVLASNAVMYNKYDFLRSTKKYYWMDRNRIIVILKNYHLLTLILILPAFIIMELGLILFSLKTGWIKEKIKVWFYFLNPAKWIYLFKARRKTQRLRKVKDKQIIHLITGKIWYQEIDDIKLRLINPIFNLYWKIIKRLIFW